MYLVSDSDGKPLDARFDIDGVDIVLHSRGGTKGKGAVNADYSKGLLMLLQRLASAKVGTEDAWVDSITVQTLPRARRSIFEASDTTRPPEDLARLFASRMTKIRAESMTDAKGGNPTRKIRIATRFGGSTEELALLLRGVRTDANHRSADRLPADVLARATPDFIWEAVQRLLAGGVEHGFGPSTDFDLIAEGGVRLPPKAVFGTALSMALGGVTIEPRHFTAGETSTCFRLLRAAGFQVVPKGEPSEAEPYDGDTVQEDGWSEGKRKLVSHLKRERAAGLAAAKKAQFLRQHGRLTCERCGLDPVGHYNSPHAEACIEVHHAGTHVAEMNDGHITKLEDLQCLCANCHRLIHRWLRAGLAQGEVSRQT